MGVNDIVVMIISFELTLCGNRIQFKVIKSFFLKISQSAKCFNAIAADITINVLLSSRIQNIHEFSSRSSILVLQMPRHLSTFSACLLVSFFLMTWHWCCMAGETNKAGPVHAFCGDDFKTAWETCCGGRCRNRKRTTGKGYRASE